MLGIPLMFSYLEVFPYEWSGLFRLWAKSEFLSNGSWINVVQLSILLGINRENCPIQRSQFLLLGMVSQIL